MAKNKDTGVDTEYIREAANIVADLTRGLKAMSDTYNDMLMKDKAALEAHRQSLEKGDISLKQYVASVVKSVKTVNELDVGLKNTTKSNVMYSKAAEELVHSLQANGQKVSKEVQDRIITYLGNLGTKGILETRKELDKGGSNVVFKNTENNKLAKSIADESSIKMGLKIDTLQGKILSFFGDAYKELDKKRKKMVDDLIEGLAASKFIGGALTDTFKLIGLLGASWLSQFGQFGRMLGGVFYVAMAAFGPTFAKLIVEGMSKLIWSGIKFLSSTIWKAVTSQAIGRGLGNAVYSMSKGGVSPALQAIAGTGAEKAAGIAKVGGLGLVGTAGLIGAKWAGGEAADSWRQGRKGNAVAMGAGAGLLGAGGLAALGAIFIPALAPVVAPLLIIGGAVALISKLWKEHSETIKKIVKPVGEFIKKALEFFWIMSPIGLLFRGLKAIVDKFAGLTKNQQTQSAQGENATVGKFNIIGGGTTSQLLTGKQIGNGNKHLDPNKFTAEDWKRADTLEPVYGKMGEIINLGQMSQKRASEVIAADIKAKGNKSFYEFVGTDLADPRSFGTDAKALDGSGVYLARGMSEKFKDMKARLEKAGFDTSNIKITSGIGTLGKPGQMSPHAYTDSITGHFSSLATTIDTSRIYNKATGRRLTQADLNNVGLGDYWLNSEGDHEHIAMKMLAWQKAAKEGKKVEATQHSISAAEALKKVDKDAYAKAQDHIIQTNRSNSQGLVMSDSDKENYYKRLLKQMGYKWDDKAQDFVHQTKGGTKDLTMINPTGNKDYQDLQQSLRRVALVGTDFDTA